MTKGSSLQTVAGREVTFDFDAQFEDIKDDPETLLIGKAGVPGALLTIAILVNRLKIVFLI